MTFSVEFPPGRGVRPVPRIAVLTGTTVRRLLLFGACRAALPTARIQIFRSLAELVYGLALDAADTVVLDGRDARPEGAAVPVILRGIAPSIRLVQVTDGADDRMEGVEEVDLDELEEWLTGASLPGRLR